MTRPTDARAPAASGLRKLRLASVSATGSMCLALAIACGIAGAWTLAILVLALGAGATALLRLWPWFDSGPGGTLLQLLARCVPLSILAFLILPVASRAPPPGVRDLALEGAPGSPWFGAVPERELVALAVTFGLTAEERRTWDDHADDLRPIAGQQRLLDGLLVDRREFRVVEPAGDGPFPTLVFLHGNGGLASLYTDLLAALAREHGVLVALPRWGFGNWTGRAAHQRIDDVVARLIAEHRADPDRIVLGGLSAGGMGALERFAADPSPFHACVAVSGVPLHGFEPHRLAGARVRLVSGIDDQRIPWARVLEVAERLGGSGAEVETRGLQGNHLVFLADRTAVHEVLLDALDAR